MWHKLATLLVILSAANIGVVSIFHVDLITSVLGDLSKLINGLVGLAGLYMVLSTYTTLLKKA